MEYVNYDEKMLQAFEYETTIQSDNQIVGVCELGKAKIQLLNENNNYSDFKGKWLKTIHGSFYIHDIKPVQEKVNIELSCYDIRYKLDTKYNSSKHNFPCTLKEWRNSIFDDCGVSYDNSDFPNSNLILEKEPYLEKNISNRNVIAQIGRAGLSLIITDSNDKFYFIWFNETIKEINDWLELTTEKTPTPAFNYVVLGRGDVGDDCGYPKTIPSNPVTFRIDNDYILDPQDVNSSSDQRDTVIVPIYERIKNFSFIVYEIKTQNMSNKLSVKLGDKIKYIDVWGNELTSYVMSKKITWLGGELDDNDNYELTLSASEFEQNSTDEVKYSNTDLKKDFFELSRKADKNSEQIQDLLKKTTDLTDYIRLSSKTNFLKLEETMYSEAAVDKLSIKGFTIKELYPDMAYPSDYTYPGVLNFYTLLFSNEQIIYTPTLPTANNQTELYNVGGISGKFYRCVDNEWAEETNLENVKFIYINSPIPLRTLTKDGVTTYDEISIENNIAKIIQRISLNDNNQEYVLDTPVTYILSETKIPTFEGNTYVTLKYWTSLIYECNYMIKNEFTSRFATLREVLNQINISSKGILIESKSYTDSSMGDGDSLIASINTKSSGDVLINASKLAEIKANQINFESYDFNLTSKNTSITSDNFKLDKDGNMDCKSAKVQGEIKSKKGEIGGWTIIDGSLTNGVNYIRSNGFSNMYTMADVFIMRAYIVGEAWATSVINEDTQIFNYYDLNGDGVIDLIDLLKLKKMVLGIDTTLN